MNYPSVSFKVSFLSKEESFKFKGPAQSIGDHMVIPIQFCIQLYHV